MRRAVPVERLAGLADPLTGLDTAAAERRRGRYGDNAIIEALGGQWQALLRDTTRDPMIWFLIGTGLLFLVIGDTREGIVMLVAATGLVVMKMATSG